MIEGKKKAEGVTKEEMTKEEVSEEVKVEEEEVGKAIFQMKYRKVKLCQDSKFHSKSITLK
jgi:hypothetical protein